MPPVSYRCAALCLVLPTFFACKPRQDDGSAVKADAVPASASSLANFDYHVTFRTLPALAGRLGAQGCQEAAQWLVEPKDKDLPAAIRAMTGSNRVYETAQDNLLNGHWAYSTCMSAGLPSVRAEGIGMKVLAETVAAKGYGLTVMVISGVGSMFTPSGPIAEAREAWQKAGYKDFQLEYVALGDVSNLEDSAAKLQSQWEQVVAKAGEKRRFLVWAHDVAGNMALEMLAQNQTFRDRTLALVTVGSPIGGVVKSMFADKIKTQLANVTGTVSAVVPVALSGNMSKFTAAMAGMASLSPESRRAYLANNLRNANFARANDDGFGEKTRVFHVASAIDPANLAPLPLVTIQNRQLAAMMTSRQMEQALLVPFLASLKDDPLSDGLISLPNAVVPKAFAPKSLDVTLIALTTLDHFGLQLTRRSDESAAQAPPYAKMVDSIIEAALPLLGGQVDGETSEEADEDAPAAAKSCAKAKKPSYMDDRWSCRAPCEWVCYSCEAEGPDPVEACR